MKRIALAVIVVTMIGSVAHGRCENETPEEHAERIGFDAQRKNYSPLGTFAKGLLRGATITLSDRLAYLLEGEDGVIGMQHSAESYPSASVAGVTSGVWILSLGLLTITKRTIRRVRERRAVS